MSTPKTPIPWICDSTASVVLDYVALENGHDVERPPVCALVK